MADIAIIDIGSNTMVLKIYDETGKEKDNGYYSIAAHLVSYIKDGVMEHAGMEAALAVLQKYRAILEERDITEVHGFITEPWRHIANADELFSVLARSGFAIEGLSGEEEALYDFLGSRLDTADIRNGNMFDIGGGSTELVSFKDGTLTASYSMPIGCLRLKTMPVERSVADPFLKEAFEAEPALLDTPNPVIIGSGGTCRAVMMMLEEEERNRPYTKERLEQLFQRLFEQEETAIAVMNKVVTPDRRDVIVPGFNLVLAIMDAFHSEEIRFSNYGVREGYLFEKVINGASKK